MKIEYFIVNIFQVIFEGHQKKRFLFLFKIIRLKCLLIILIDFESF